MQTPESITTPAAEQRPAHNSGGAHSPSVRQAPAALQYAVALAGALALLGVLRVVLTFVQFDAIMDAYVSSRGDTAAPREFVESGAPAYKAIALIFAVGLGSLLWVLTLVVRSGARWARIAATACGLLVAFGGLTTLMQPNLTSQRILGVLTIAGTVGVIVLLFKGASTAFLDRRRTSR